MEERSKSIRIIPVDRGGAGGAIPASKIEKEAAPSSWSELYRIGDAAVGQAFLPDSDRSLTSTDPIRVRQECLTYARPDRAPAEVEGNPGQALSNRPDGRCQRYGPEA